MSSFKKTVSAKYEVRALLRIAHAQMLQHHIGQWGDDDTVHWEHQGNDDLLVYHNDRAVFYITPHLLPVLKKQLATQAEEDRVQERKKPEPREAPKKDEPEGEKAESCMPPSGGVYKLR